MAGVASQASPRVLKWAMARAVALGTWTRVDFGFGDDAEGSFGADYHSAEVDAAAVEELVQVVAADAAHDVRGVAIIYFVAVLVGYVKNAAVDFGFQVVAAQLAFEFRRVEVGEMGFLSRRRGLRLDPGRGRSSCRR